MDIVDQYTASPEKKSSHSGRSLTGYPERLEPDIPRNLEVPASRQALIGGMPSVQPVAGIVGRCLDGSTNPLHVVKAVPRLACIREMTKILTHMLSHS